MLASASNDCTIVIWSIDHLRALRVLGAVKSEGDEVHGATVAAVEKSTAGSGKVKGKGRNKRVPIDEEEEDEDQSQLRQHRLLRQFLNTHMKTHDRGTVGQHGGFGHEATVLCLDFASDGRLLVSCGGDQKVSKGNQVSNSRVVVIVMMISEMTVRRVGGHGVRLTPLRHANNEIPIYIVPHKHRLSSGIP